LRQIPKLYSESVVLKPLKFAHFRGKAIALLDQDQEFARYSQLKGREKLFERA